MKPSLISDEIKDPLVLELNSLMQWFSSYKRDLPWREDKNPYRVWIAETMLQQTRVEAVIPYFLRWLERFPSITDLASASIEEVIKAWEGLGYYSRARNLHKCAHHIIKHHHGVLPSDETLLTLPGIGPYTAAAILSFGFGKKAAPIDANVDRVLSRFWEVSEKAIDKRRSLLQKRLYYLLPDQKSELITEGLIELGAVICKPLPNCFLCPLQRGCQAFKNRTIEQFPPKAVKPSKIDIHRLLLVIEKKNKILLYFDNKGLMADLYQFPYFPLEEYLRPEHWLHKLGIDPENYQTRALSKVKHTFTRFHATLHPWYLQLFEDQEIDLERKEGYRWIPKEDLHSLSFPSGHREIKQLILRDFL